ncbi:MAG: spore germination protein [Bacteroidota bacterium]
MPLPKPLKNLVTFKEPRAEPGFVLAWDEPGEVEAKENKERDFYDERFLLAPGTTLTGDLAADIGIFAELFGKHGMLGRRDLRVGGKGAAVLFLLDSVDRKILADDIIARIPAAGEARLESILAELATDRAAIEEDPNRGLERLLHGNTLILLAGERRFIVAGSKGSPHRQIGKPVSERVVKGSQESLVEDLETNLALIRKHLRTPRLRVQEAEVGTLSRTRCAVLHVDGITNPRLVKEVLRRVHGIKTSFIMDSGELEQLIEDNTYFPYAQILSIERPERVAAALAEGKVAVLVDGSLLALVMPATFPGLLHTAEDYSTRWPNAIYQRFVRVIAVFVILFGPALYLAYNLYQPEFLPTDLLFTLIDIKQRTPLPTIIELLFLELVFEFLREASIRSPQYLSMPLIIGVAIFLGLAAIFTNIVNPVLLFIVAFTGIGAFVIPEFSTSVSYRLTRYFYIASALAFGFIGIAFSAYLHLFILVRQKSFGVPMLAPIAPLTRRSRDIVLMRPTVQRGKRPDQFDPLQVRRQPKRAQIWKEEEQEKPLEPPEGKTPGGDEPE